MVLAVYMGEVRDHNLSQVATSNIVATGWPEGPTAPHHLHFPHLTLLGRMRLPNYGGDGDTELRCLCFVACVIGCCFARYNLLALNQVSPSPIDPDAQLSWLACMC